MPSGCVAVCHIAPYPLFLNFLKALDKAFRAFVHGVAHRRESNMELQSLRSFGGNATGDMEDFPYDVILYIIIYYIYIILYYIIIL